MPRAAATGRATRWVALMYHDVVPATSARGGGPERFSVPLSSFERMLDTIVEAGYAGCTMEAALERPGERRVAITFDDGTDGQFLHAAPALRARGMSATFFVTTDWIGTPGFMTWEQLRELVAAGMSVQSHTRSHPFLSELDEAGVLAELRGSKAELDARLGQDTTSISLPGGDAPRRRLRHVLDDAGYRYVAGSRWGLNGDTAAGYVRRCTMRSDTSTDMARRILDGDPWMYAKRALREETLGRLRSTLGAGRYARLRRRLLDSVQPARS